MPFVLIAAFVLLLLAYLHVYRPLKYWSNRGYPSLTPFSVFGNFLPNALKMESFFDTFIRIHRSTHDKLIGFHMFTQPALLIKDLELIRQITIKNFNNFVDHSKTLLNTDSEPNLRRNLLNICGQDWRKMRHTLSPAFTASRMRGMLPLMGEITENFCRHLTNGTKQSDVFEIHSKNLFGRYTSDLIATTAFGIAINSVDDPENVFYKQGVKAFAISNWKLTILNLFGSKIFQLLKLNVFDEEASDYLIRVFKKSLKARRQQGVVRMDMLHLLLEAQKNSIEQAKTDPDVKELTDEDIIAQTFTFFFAGYDTSSSQLSFTVLELALNPGVQQKLYEEIDRIRNADGSLSYDAILENKYLEMVLLESERKWPQDMVIDRECTSAFTLDVDGKNYKINKGDVVFSSIIGNHRDPRIYPSPDVFDPERFTPEMVKSRHSCAFLTFGSGPRQCIGTRFAGMAMKVLLANCVKDFEFVLTDNSEVPITWSLDLAFAVPKCDIVGVRARH